MHMIFSDVPLPYHCQKLTHIQQRKQNSFSNNEVLGTDEFRFFRFSCSLRSPKSDSRSCLPIRLIVRITPGTTAACPRNVESDATQNDDFVVERRTAQKSVSGTDVSPRHTQFLPRCCGCLAIPVFQCGHPVVLLY
jgi:hypothetical protein